MTTGPSRELPGPSSSARPSSRRAFLRNAGGGFGMTALATMLARDGLLAPELHLRSPISDLKSPTRSPRRQSHFPAKAKRVIFLFMSGGPSHVDMFDPKPELHPARRPAAPGIVRHVQDAARGGEEQAAAAAAGRSSRTGSRGIEVSDLLPHIAEHADDLCLLRGCHGDSVTHPESVYLMNTGSILMGQPSLGAWATYGLGTENQNMPAFVVLPDPAGWVKGGAPAWGNGFLPATYQGTLLRGGASPILNLNTPTGVSAQQQRRRSISSTSSTARPCPPASATPNSPRASPPTNSRSACSRTRRRSWTSRRRPPPRRKLYGLDNKTTAEFGLRCLLARRMVERGVRFVQLYCGDTNGWDGHTDVEGNHTKLCAQSDLPIAGLLTDLKSRGLLDSTLVIWGGEFGRTPMSEGSERPRPQPARLLHVAGRRRREGRHRSSARPTPSACAPPRRRRTSTTSTRRSCTCSASTTRG